MNNVNKTVLVAVAVMLVGANVSWGALTTPTALPYYAGAQHSTYVAANMIDGSSSSFSVINDDDGVTAGVQGHTVFDMGSARPVDGMALTSRNYGTSLNPDNVDFFYYVDDDPSNNGTIDDIEGDADIVLIRNYTWGGIVNGDTKKVSWAATDAKRYIGMRVNTSRTTNFQLAEIRVDANRTLAGTLTSPTAIQQFSGTEHATYTASKMIDGDSAGDSFSVIYDDDAVSSGIQGHLVFDMGTANEIDGVSMSARDLNQNLNPEDVDFFYYADDDPSNNTLADDIEGDADIVLITDDMWGQMSDAESDTIGWDTFGAKRYIGMRINSSYTTNYQLSEIEFSVIPEPATMGLFSFAGLGLLLRRLRM